MRRLLLLPRRRPGTRRAAAIRSTDGLAQRRVGGGRRVRWIATQFTCLALLFTLSSPLPVVVEHVPAIPTHLSAIAGPVVESPVPSVSVLLTPLIAVRRSRRRRRVCTVVVRRWRIAAVGSARGWRVRKARAREGGGSG